MMVTGPVSFLFGIIKPLKGIEMLGFPRVIPMRSNTVTFQLPLECPCRTFAGPAIAKEPVSIYYDAISISFYCNAGHAPEISSDTVRERVAGHHY
jgi:hypothetical protein